MNRRHLADAKGLPGVVAVGGVHVAYETHELSRGQGDRRAGSSHRRDRPR